MHLALGGSAIHCTIEFHPHRGLSQGIIPQIGDTRGALPRRQTLTHFHYTFTTESSASSPLHLTQLCPKKCFSVRFLKAANVATPSRCTAFAAILDMLDGFCGVCLPRSCLETSSASLLMRSSRGAFLLEEYRTKSKCWSVFSGTSTWTTPAEYLAESHGFPKSDKGGQQWQQWQHILTSEFDLPKRDGASVRNAHHAPHRDMLHRDWYAQTFNWRGAQTSLVQEGKINGKMGFWPSKLFWLKIQARNRWCISWWGYAWRCFWLFGSESPSPIIMHAVPAGCAIDAANPKDLRTVKHSWGRQGMAEHGRKKSENDTVKNNIFVGKLTVWNACVEGPRGQRVKVPGISRLWRTAGSLSLRVSWLESYLLWAFTRTLKNAPLCWWQVRTQDDPSELAE